MSEKDGAVQGGFLAQVIPAGLVKRFFQILCHHFAKSVLYWIERNPTGAEAPLKRKNENDRNQDQKKYPAMKPNSNPRYQLACFLGLCGLLLGALTTARAATNTVLNLDDSGPGSLRQAIADAAPGDTIDFAVTGTITLTSGQLVITNDLTISGPGATNLTVSGNNASRVFEIKNARVALSGLSIADGASPAGGGIYSGVGCTLILMDSTIRSNSASTCGGVYAEGSFSALNSSFISNIATYAAGGLQVHGQGVLVNCTISHNIGFEQSGGIMCSAGSIVLTNCTVAMNSGGAGPGGIGTWEPNSPIVRLQNTIIANNTSVAGSSADCAGEIISSDYNLIQNTNGATITGFTTHDIYGKDPLLGPLADNGGPTLTHALLPGSPGIDQGSSGGLATDQRGRPRPVNFATIPDVGDGSDIGAYEVQGRSVTTLDDSGPGSLRQAIADAAPGDTINFAVTGTITLTSGQLVITNDLTISGPGATNLTVSGNSASRVFGAASGIVRLSGLTIANGMTIYPDYLGGGILNGTSLTISNCAVINNSASGWRNHPGGGGGVYNGGNLVVQDSRISNNSASDYGGGIDSLGSLVVVNTTITSNHSRSSGGGAMVQTISMTNATISGNSTDFGWAGAGLHCISGGTISCSSVVSNAVGVGINILGGGASLNIQNSIVARNSGGDCSGAFTSDDYNLIGNTNGATITGVTTHNIYGKDPLLGPLADNGGPTPTHALLPGSPAIDQGSSGGLATDQRGQPRSFNFPAYFNADDGSDIGAYELQERAQTGPVFTVTTTDDAEDGVPGIAHCSLREAIAAANANADTNTIDFAVAVPGLHTGVTGTITLTNVVAPNYGRLQITRSVAIVGPSPSNLSISGNNAYRVFYLYGAGEVAISGLKITNGKLPSAFGPPESFIVGAGIYNDHTTLHLSDCVISGNTNDFYAGGIWNSGNVTINNCIISSNRSDGGGGGIRSEGSLSISNSIVANNFSPSGWGGGIVNNDGPMAVVNSTISGNKAHTVGGIYSTDFSSGRGNVSIQSCTISSNTATSGEAGGILHYAVGTLSVRNSIVAGNSAFSSGPDLRGGINSLDYNLIQNTNGCTITNLTAHNLYNLDPKLGPLADLGGPTPTHALRFDSPAIDAGNSGGLTTDQRGLPRPIDDPNTPNADGGDGSDIGAYEADPNLRIMAIEKAGSDIRLRFNTVFGRNYSVESEDNLDNSWTTLSNNIPGTGGSAQVLDAGTATLPKRFYRGVLLLP